MSELLTQSRPYAEAVFDIAKEEQALDDWVNDLSLVVSTMKAVSYTHLRAHET